MHTFAPRQCSIRSSHFPQIFAEMTLRETIAHRVEVKQTELTNDKRSEAGKKGAEALQEKHEREGLTEAEREQRSEAGRKGGEK